MPLKPALRVTVTAFFLLLCTVSHAQTAAQFALEERQAAARAAAAKPLTEEQKAEAARQAAIAKSLRDEKVDMLKAAARVREAQAEVTALLSVLDVNFYLGTYPDLQAKFGGNIEAARQHWLNAGAKEGRVPKKDFCLPGRTLIDHDKCLIVTPWPTHMRPPDGTKVAIKTVGVQRRYGYPHGDQYDLWSRWIGIGSTATPTTDPKAVTGLLASSTFRLDALDEKLTGRNLFEVKTYSPVGYTLKGPNGKYVNYRRGSSELLALYDEQEAAVFVRYTADNRGFDRLAMQRFPRSELRQRPDGAWTFVGNDGTNNVWCLAAQQVVRRGDPIRDIDWPYVCWESSRAEFYLVQ